MSRFRLNTRVTLGISFCPFWIRGFTVGVLSLPAVNSESFMSMRCPLRITELIGTRFCSLFKLGTTNLFR